MTSNCHLKGSNCPSKVPYEKKLSPTRLPPRSLMRQDCHQRGSLQGRLADNCQILAIRSDICKIGQLSDRTTVSANNCQIGQVSVRTTVSADNCQWGQLSVRTTVSGTTVSGPWTTVRKNCQCSEKTVRSYSCPLTNCKILQLSPTKLSVQQIPIV